jgi:pantoate--beta-alanine ligase
VTATPVVAATRADLDRELGRLRAGGRTVALVPTMGALHAGHRALIVRAHEVADVVVVSIFVNPLQFGPAEDLTSYPRPFDADLAVCADERVDLVWAPDVRVVYPDGNPLVTVSAGRLGELLEGAVRPGHFDGVLTVVAKLIGQVGPDVLVFGRKDAQQLVLVRRMILDLELGPRIEGVATVRDADGLAVSSRNVYLSYAERVAGLVLGRALAAGAAAAEHGPEAIRTAATAVLDSEPALIVDYLALVDPVTLAPAQPEHVGELLLLVAGRVGTTRLLDAASVSCLDRQAV